MQILSKTATFDQYKSDCSVIFVDTHAALDATTKQADTLCHGHLSQAIKAGDLKAEAGASIWLYPSNSKSQRVLVVATKGKPKQGAPKNQPTTQAEFRSICTSTARALLAKNINNATVHLDNLKVADTDTQFLAHTLSQKLIANSYRYTATKPTHAPLPTLSKITLALTGKTQLNSLKKGIASGLATGTGINTARELGNLPGNICTPSYLAKEAQKLAKSAPSLTTKILSEAEMKKLGMGSLLSVSAGSVEPAKLIVMEYKGKQYFVQVRDYETYQGYNEINNGKILVSEARKERVQ